jgi:hypothetical protein
MMTVFRRFLLLMALGFWQGGFTFHAAVVIHVGHDVLGSHLQQGYITGAAANYLNLAGLVTLMLTWRANQRSVRHGCAFLTLFR